MRTPQPVKDFGAAVVKLGGLLGKQPPPAYCKGCGCWNRGKCTQASTPEACAAQDEADRRISDGEDEGTPEWWERRQAAAEAEVEAAREREVKRG